MLSPQLFDVQVIRDERGALGVVESGRELPFAPKRMYYLFDVHAGASRGAHAHQALQQAFIAVSGACEVSLTDGIRNWTFLLNDPSRGLFVPPGYWRSLGAFSGGTVLVVLASALYDENDYIRDWKEYLEWRDSLSFPTTLSVEG